MASASWPQLPSPTSAGVSRSYSSMQSKACSLVKLTSSPIAFGYHPLSPEHSFTSPPDARDSQLAKWYTIWKTLFESLPVPAHPCKCLYSLAMAILLVGPAYTNHLLHHQFMSQTSRKSFKGDRGSSFSSEM